jgi:hypothetical protein
MVGGLSFNLTLPYTSAETMEQVMQAYPGGRSEIMRTHVRPSTNSLKPVIGFTFLAGLYTKGIVLLLIDSDQDLFISYGRRLDRRSLPCCALEPRLVENWHHGINAW